MNTVNLKVAYEHKWIHHPLRIKWFVDQQVMQDDISGNQQIIFEKNLSLDNGFHTFGFEISKKNNKHTKIDNQKKIIKDTIIQIKDIRFDDISVMQLVKNKKDFYQFVGHNSDHKIEQSDIFGYNGTMTIQFQMPIYQWLLEKLF